MILPKAVVCFLAIPLAVSAGDRTLAEGQQLLTEGRYGEAIEVLTTVLHEAEKLQSDSRSLAVVLDKLGFAESEAGNFGDAERALNRAQSLLSAGRSNDPASIELKRHLAELYSAEMRLSDAENLLRQAVGVLNSTATANRTELALAVNDLAIICAMRGKRPEAETLLHDALALLEAEFGPDHATVANGLESLAALLVGEHRYAEAVAPAERAARLLESAYPPDRASALIVLAKVYAHTGRAPEAVNDAAHAVALAESVYGPGHQRLGIYLQCYADVLAQADRKKQAREVKKRADAILAQQPHNAGAGYTVSISALR